MKAQYVDSTGYGFEGYVNASDYARVEGTGGVYHEGWQWPKFSTDDGDRRLAWKYFTEEEKDAYSKNRKAKATGEVRPRSSTPAAPAMSQEAVKDYFDKLALYESTLEFLKKAKAPEEVINSQVKPEEPTWFKVIRDVLNLNLSSDQVARIKG